MNSNATDLDSSAARARPNPLLRGFMEGAAGLFDIFGACRLRCGTPEDDAEELRGDVERIAQDFYAVFANIESASNK